MYLSYTTRPWADIFTTVYYIDYILCDLVNVCLLHDVVSHTSSVGYTVKLPGIRDVTHVILTRITLSQGLHVVRNTISVHVQAVVRVVWVSTYFFFNFLILHYTVRSS